MGKKRVGPREQNAPTALTLKLTKGPTRRSKIRSEKRNDEGSVDDVKRGHDEREKYLEEQVEKLSTNLRELQETYDEELMEGIKKQHQLEAEVDKVTKLRSENKELGVRVNVLSKESGEMEREVGAFEVAVAEWKEKERKEKAKTERLREELRDVTERLHGEVDRANR